jgi:hypothetical protein
MLESLIVMMSPLNILIQLYIFMGCVYGILRLPLQDQRSLHIHMFGCMHSEVVSTIRSIQRYYRAIMTLVFLISYTPEPQSLFRENNLKLCCPSISNATENDYDLQVPHLD